MRLKEVIKKNILLLLRSNISTLVLILGPLLIIMLVGLSFSTSSYNLKMGVYSERYSDMSTSFVEKLRTEGYGMVKFNDEKSCIESVKFGNTHACIIFPPDMVISNDLSSVVKFHVDQSKINLVYLVMSSLESSMGEKSTEISMELTNKIVVSLKNTKDALQKTLPSIVEIKDKNDKNKEGMQNSVNALEDLDLELVQVNGLDSSFNKIKEDADNLLLDSADLIGESLNYVDRLDTLVTGNGTAYLSSLETRLKNLNKTISDNHNLTIEDLNDAAAELNSTLNDLSSKLQEAKNVDSQVIQALKVMTENSNAIKIKALDIEDSLKAVVADIDSIQITNIENIVNPIKTEIIPIVNTQSNLSFLFPSLVVILIMFLGLFLPSTLIIMEKNSKAFFRVFTTPTKNRLFIAATYLTGIILITFQVAIILVISHFYFKLGLGSPIIYLVLFVIMSFFVLSGMLIGNLFNTEEMAMLASVSIGILFLLISGIIFPLESMPAYIAEKAKFNPLVISSQMFKESLYFQATLTSLKEPLAYLLLFSLLALLMIVLIKKYGNIVYLLKKPDRLRTKRDYLKGLFDFGGRKAKTLAEFIVSIQNLNEDRFQGFLRQYAYSEWIALIYRNYELAKKVETASTREEILNLLVEELKKISQKK
jgi:ABC-type multidrug transport system permease subunit